MLLCARKNQAGINKHKDLSNIYTSVMSNSLSVYLVSLPSTFWSSSRRHSPPSSLGVCDSRKSRAGGITTSWIAPLFLTPALHLGGGGGGDGVGGKRGVSHVQLLLLRTHHISPFRRHRRHRSRSRRRRHSNPPDCYPESTD